MVAPHATERLNLPIAATAAVVSGAIVALAVALVPHATLEGSVVASGIPAVLPAAAPPLGSTARAALVLLLGGGASAMMWGVLQLVLGGRALSLPVRRAADPDAPTIRRADAHPDAPPRAPVRAARDLGSPFLDALRPPAEQALPADLDQPLSAFDGGAIPDVPAAPVPLVRPLYRADDARIETFELTPLHRGAGASATHATAAVDREASLRNLLVRLDRGVARHDGPVTPPRSPAVDVEGLDATLFALRRLATGG